jgi:hypothetical protein
MTTLRIICDGGQDRSHTAAELAVIEWMPAEFESKGLAIWDAKARPKGLAMSVKGDSTSHSGRSDAPRRVIHRTKATITTRADGGQTVHVPACPRCATPARAIRDTKLREYLEANRDTPNSALNMALM